MESIQNILQTISTSNKFKSSYQSAKIQDLWKDIVGQYIAEKTQKVFVRKNKLYVKISFSVIRNEILLTKEEVLKNINSKLQTEIEDIVFL